MDVPSTRPCQPAQPSDRARSDSTMRLPIPKEGSLVGSIFWRSGEADRGVATSAHCEADGAKATRHQRPGHKLGNGATGREGEIVITQPGRIGGGDFEPCYSAECAQIDHHRS